jgi:hypothetical protein
MSPTRPRRPSLAPEPEADDALQGLAAFASSRLVVAGGFGSDGSGPQQWRSMWDAFKQYSTESSDPSKEEIERSLGCNYYQRDLHVLNVADAHDGRAPWQSLAADGAAARLFARTGHSLTSLQQRRTALLFGGANHQQSGSAYMNDVWTIELDSSPRRPGAAVAELRPSGCRPSARAHHTASLLGSGLYILGGCGAADRPLRDVHRLDTRSWSWSQPVVRGHPPAILCRHTATPMLGAIFVFGGCTLARAAGGARGGASKLSYSAQLHVLCEVRAACACLVLGKGKEA